MYPRSLAQVLAAAVLVFVSVTPVAGQVETEHSDAPAIAAMMRWDLAQAEAAIEHQHRFHRLLELLIDQYPDTFAGGWTVHQPATQSFVRFKAEVPATASAWAKQLGADVQFLGGAAFSEHELETRADQLHADLRSLGAPTVSTTYSVQEQRILGEASVPPEHADTPHGQLERLLPLRSRGPDFVVTFSAEPVAVDTTTYGGVQMAKDTGLETDCTSGFSVRLNTIGGTTGVVTAAHCPSIYRISDPVAGAWLDPTFVSSHLGTWGDMEWHTVPGTESPSFYVSATSRRPVASIDTVVANGDMFCRFGRATGYRCDTVLNNNISCSPPSGTVFRLVAMNDLSLNDGDSGGPWFLQNTAAGITKGRCNASGSQRDSWSRAMYFEEGLGVSVMISP